MATHSSILAWRIPWTEEPGGLQSMGLQRVWHDWVNTHSLTVYWNAFFKVNFYMPWGSPGGSVVKNLTADTRASGNMGLIPGSGRSSEEVNGNLLQYSCWIIPWTEEPGGLQPMGSQRVGHNWARMHIYVLTNRLYLLFLFFLVLYSRFSLVIYFIHSSVYVFWFF